MSVNVRDNNIDRALRSLRTQAAPALSKLRDRQEFKKPGVRRREEKKQNTINSRRNSKKAERRVSRTFERKVNPTKQVEVKKETVTVTE